jgi:hypothetical protein
VLLGKPVRPSARARLCLTRAPLSCPARPLRRLSTPFPITSGQGLPLIHVTQDWLLCAAPAKAPGSPIPTCAVNAWRLPPRAPPAPAGRPEKALRLRAGTADAPLSSSPAAGGGGGGAAGGGGSHDPYLTGRPAPVGPGGRPPVLLVVGEQEGFDPWQPVLAETGPGRLAALTSAPGALLMASPEGQVRAAALLGPAAAAAAGGGSGEAAPAAQ